MISKISFAKGRDYIRATDLFIYVDKKHRRYSSINFMKQDLYAWMTKEPKNKIWKKM